MMSNCKQFGSQNRSWNIVKNRLTFYCFVYYTDLYGYYLFCDGDSKNT